MQKLLNKLKEKIAGTYLKLIDSLVKPVILYACESWVDSQTNKFLETELRNSICQCASKY